MNGIKTITDKLHQFTRKYYVNELIRGGLLFFSFGFFYLLCTLFLEHFLWLKPTARTFLFLVFVLVEVFLFWRFIIVPVFKLIGLQKGITPEKCSNIIGRFFPEVKDKLLNTLQLKEQGDHSDLLLASINQKSEELLLIPFVKAVNFSKNLKYLKYAILPVVIFLITLLSGNNNLLKESLDRVVHYRTAYTPPAPFYFRLTNKNLQVVQGSDITIHIETLGSVLPAEVKIKFDKQEYFLQNNGLGNFSFTFSNVQKPMPFFLEANKVQSTRHHLTIINTPTINNIILKLEYPSYVGKKNETIPNSGNLIVPEGTKITWNVLGNQTQEVAFIENTDRALFNKLGENNFQFTKQIKNSFTYQVTSSNQNLKDYERLQFSIGVVKDNFPKILMQSNNNESSKTPTQFFGQVSDDYGLSKLQIVYYEESNPQDQKVCAIGITKADIQTFFYLFPDSLSVNKGVNYELFFEVYDNDMVNGNKKAKSTIFKYREKTNEELNQELLDAQRSTINNMDRAILNQQKQQRGIEKLQEGLQKNKKFNWSDKKKVDDFLKRQKQYKEMMRLQTKKLQETLKESEEEDKTLQEKKEELQKRIDELKKNNKQQKLLDEIAKIAEKLNKEELGKKIKQLAEQNKQQERSLERTLELVKRFYIEQKTMQIVNKLNDLAKEQELLEKKDADNLEDQKEIKKGFEKIKKELNELTKDNKGLKEPMELPDVEEEKKDIDQELNKAEEGLKNKKKSSAKKNQKNSAKKMQKMSAKMQKAMLEMEGESIEENMDDMRKVLENLMTFSFKQEALMNKFDAISITHPDFGKDLKKQNNIRTYFEHIDDSLYVLSMRLPKISSKIQNDLSTAHYNLEQSLENFSEGRFDNGISNQRYVMTSVNNLSDYLSTMLNNMKNASMKMGAGKKSKGFSLPDIIKKQGELSEKMKKGREKSKELARKPGKKSGEEKGDGKKGEKPSKNDEAGKNINEPNEGGLGEKGTVQNDDLDGELYEIYKQQTQLRQQLQTAIKESRQGNEKNFGQIKKVLKSMEQLENEILEKGFSARTIQKMQQLNYDLLKLDTAALEQGKENKRKATVNRNTTNKNDKKPLDFKKQFYNQIEILNRQSLPLHKNYKLKVRDYFSEPNKREND
tara:strand:+ start:3341 stop:6727 length:3387 start_codon:yes stop_codon:yes gene_type:complete